MAKKKKYSKSTKEAARLFGKTKGWKKLSQKRIQTFIDSVELATGYVNKSSIQKYADVSLEIYKVDVKKITEAAKQWAQNNFPEWDRLSKERLDTFKNEFQIWAESNNIEASSDNALEFAKQSFGVELDEFGQEVISEPVYIIENMPGWNDSDVVDDLMNLDNFVEIRLVDVDGFIVYIGNDRTDFWDIFRGLGGDSQFPIYDSYYEQDEFGNLFITVKIVGYYP